MLLCKFPACTCPPASSLETHSYGLTSVRTRIFERSNQKQLCFLYKFIMPSVLLVVQGCLMQMRGGKRNGKGLRWPSSVGVGTEPDHSEQRYSESDRSRGLGFQLCLPLVTQVGWSLGTRREVWIRSLRAHPKENILVSSLQAYFLLLQKLSLWGPAVWQHRLLSRAHIRLLTPACDSSCSGI